MDKETKAGTFGNFKEAAEALIASMPQKVIFETGKKGEQSVLYFANASQMKTLLSIQARIDEVFDKPRDKKHYGFGLIANILNPTGPVSKYSTGIRGRHRQMTKSDTVRREIEGEFEVWKNSQLVRMRDTLESSNLNAAERAKTVQEVEQRIDEGEREFTYVLEHFDELKICIAGYNHEKSYAYIQYVDADEKRCNQHLSIKVPNILFYEPVHYRKDMKIADFIKDATCAFGDVFYMQREKEQ
jgi:hypothetical protein